MNKNIGKAVKIVKNGGVIIFPTDTAYGIGTRVDSTDSVKRLFEVRRRPKDKAVPVLVSSIKMAQEYALNIDEKALDLMKKHWPGGLTIVVECDTNKVPSLVRGGGKTIGFRMPNHRTTLSMIRKTGVPILAPSANFAGEATPFSYKDLDNELKDKVDYVLKGRCKGKVASTVVDTTVKPFKILRQGAVTLR